MKSFKFARVVVLVLSSLGVLLSGIDTGAATRVGVSSVHVSDEDMPTPTSYGGYKKWQKFQDRYHELFMNALSQTGNFEAVKLEINPFNPYQMSGSENGKKYEGYRPYYSRSMGTRVITADNDAIMKQYNNIRINKARQEKCRYTLEASAMFDNSSKKEISATVFLRVLNVENGEVTHFTGTGAAPLASGKRASTTKKSSPTRSKKDKNADSESEGAKEKAAIEAFAQAIAFMRDETAGNIAQVTDIKANSIIINRGAASKVRLGDIFFVQVEATEGMGDIFGPAPEESSIINLAIIRVDDVQGNTSSAEIVEGAGNINAIRGGDRIMLRPESDIERILSEIASGNYPPFPDKHPEVKQAEAQPTTSHPTVAELEPLPALPPGTIRVGVVKFDSNAEGISEAEASALTDLFMRMLSNSDKIAVLERDRLEAVAREQKLTLSGVLDPETAARIGKLAGCQYILVGSVTGLEERDFIEGRYIDPMAVAKRREAIGKIGGRAGQILAGIELLTMIVDAGKENVVTETREIVTNVDARLVNVETSQITASFTEQGSAAQSDVVTQDMDGDIKGVEASYGSLQSRAIASVAANLGHKIREALTGEQVQISSVNDAEIIINRGSTSGVQTGDLFCVYSEGQEDGDTEAILLVTDVQTAFSTGEIAKSITGSYSPAPGYRLEAVSHGDFERGIWHIKNQRRAQAAEKNQANISLEELASGSGRRKRLETSSTDAKKVIKSYGLDARKEKALIDAHSKAAKGSSTKKKYEGYKQLSDANVEDFLAAYNTGQHALKLSKYAEAREYASKAVFVNPRYKPAQTLIEKIDKGD